MAVYITIKSDDRDKLSEVMDKMHHALKGFKPYINDDVALCNWEGDEFIFAVGTPNENDYEIDMSI